jgi:hypothetical protein
MAEVKGALHEWILAKRREMTPEMPPPSDRQIAWFKQTLAAHFSLHFSPRATAALHEVGIRYVRLNDISDTTEGGILLPVDISSEVSGPTASFGFSTTRVVTVQPLPRPAGSKWRLIEAEGVPVWWRNATGALMPAWNLYGVCAGLLLATEELASTARDEFGRFPSDQSIRHANRLLERPTVNEAFALVAAALCALFDRNERWFDLRDLVLPPLLFLSHDCDNLKGNNVWLQLSRVARFSRSMVQKGTLEWAQLHWMLKGVLRPRAGFAEELLEYMALEEAYGFFSRFYFINGTRGRYGARSSTAEAAKVACEVGAPHEIGVHYNYDTCVDLAALTRQVEGLREATGKSLHSGRAHYLRLDAASSPRIWEEAGIRLDESFGSDVVPIYRLGLAGAFRWFDLKSDRALNLVECPLIFEDMAMMQTWPTNPLAGLLSHARHVAAVGGSLSILFHPGYLKNPEFQTEPSLYANILSAMRDLRVRQLALPELLSAFGVGLT